MSVSQSQRHQLFQWLEEAMGPERAAVMMDLLPPVGWSDLATKTDVAMVRIEVKGEMAELRGEMAHGFARMQKHIYLSMLAAVQLG